ncbi:MAG TPA: VCBS repeat-containing protein [Vicinamibacterales bacterium]
MRGLLLFIVVALIVQPGEFTQLSPPALRPAVAYDSGGYLPGGTAVADLDGDAQADLVIANSYACPYFFCPTGSVGVLLGTGDGTFRPAVTYGSGAASTNAVAVGDLNGDAKPDLIVVSFCADVNNCLKGAVSVLLGNGDGTFQAAATYDSGGYGSQSLAVADMNGDHSLDVVVANQIGGVSELLGNGDGTFQPSRIVGVGPEYGHSIAVADVNADERSDLIIGNTCISYPYHCTDLVGVLQGNGDGSFQSAVAYPSGDEYQSSVTIADVNGDGSPDLLAANLDSTTLGVLIGTGTGSFRRW